MSNLLLLVGQQLLPEAVPTPWVLLAGFLLAVLMTLAFAALAWTESRWQIEVRPWVPLWLPAVLGLLLLSACLAAALVAAAVAEPAVDEAVGGTPPAAGTPIETAVAALVETAVATLGATPTQPLPTSTATPVPFPSSCAAVRRADRAAADGTYTLYLNGRAAYPMDVYCHDMAGNPREYLTLPNSGGGANYALISHPAGALVTHYQKLRFDPATLAVDAGDHTFATFAGEVPGYDVLPPEAAADYAVAVSEYGRAQGCSTGTAVAPPGAANIDLRGTPFIVAADVTFAATGTAIEAPLIDVSADRRVVNLAVSGRCAQVAAVGGVRLAYGVGE